MKQVPVWFVCALAGGFGFIGGRLGASSDSDVGVGSVVGGEQADGQMVLAQTQLGQRGGISQEPPQRLMDIVLLNDTLVFRSRDGQPLMVLSNSANGGALYLMDAAGQPSIGLLAGSQGKIAISAAEAGGEITVGPRQGNTMAALRGAPSGPSLELLTNGQKVLSLLTDGVGAQILGADPRGQSKFELKVDKASGILELKKPDGKAYAQFEHSSTEGGSLELFGETNIRRLNLSGEGGVHVREQGKVKAALPPVTDGDGTADGAGDGS